MTLFLFQGFHGICCLTCFKNELILGICVGVIFQYSFLVIDFCMPIEVTLAFDDILSTLGCLFVLVVILCIVTQSVICRNLRSSVYDINEDVSEKQFPEFNKAEWIECIQEQNEIIFVPSGWYHQVYNLEDTISINHNWFNAYNLHWVWNLLHEDHKVAKEYIEDIRDICDNFEALCQRNLAANTGMNFYDFFIFITRFVLANVIELYHVQKPEDAKVNSPEATHHYVYNLMQIREVASKMISAEAFSIENLCVISEGNRSAMSDVTKILKDDGFRRLWMTLSEAYECIRRGQRILYKVRYLNQKGCLSVTCLKSYCNVVDRITFFMRVIRGPEDLVRLIDTALPER
uniref:JmjC domain-containing protein n=1 Tax=Aegilops tauschii subsp. strangulata TaxID=200361 RepID=A0A453ET29_AEGTS